MYFENLTKRLKFFKKFNCSFLKKKFFTKITLLDKFIILDLLLLNFELLLKLIKILVRT